MLREQEHVGLLIAAAQRSVKMAVHRRARALGLTAQQFWFLNAARELPGATLGEIARQRRMDAPTASRLAEGLARRGLVRTAPDDRDPRAQRTPPPPPRDPAAGALPPPRAPGGPWGSRSPPPATGRRSGSPPSPPRSATQWCGACRAGSRRRCARLCAGSSRI